MTTNIPIHASAARPVEFIPLVQDAAKYERITNATLLKRAETVERYRSEAKQARDRGEMDAEAFEERIAELDTAGDLIAEDRLLMERNLQFMRKKYPSPQRFMLTVPTTVEREQINSRMVSLGLRQVTQEQIRATMIEELYHQDWSEAGETLTPDQNDVRADDNANFLDGVWMRQEAHDEAVRRWQEQEIERVTDIAEGAPETPRADTPPKIVTVRETARMQLLVDRMMKDSQRLRNLAASNMDFARQNTLLLVRIHVVGVEGFEPTVPLVRDRHTRALTEEAVAALREQVDDPSWSELVRYIDLLYTLEESERKNFDSPPAKLSRPGGSIGQSDVQEASGGSSTSLSSEPAPVDGSETITEPSSSYTSASSMTPATAEPVSPMGED